LHCYAADERAANQNTAARMGNIPERSGGQQLNPTERIFRQEVDVTARVYCTAATAHALGVTGKYKAEIVYDKQQ
jgi:hypothetical protein